MRTLLAAVLWLLASSASVVTAQADDAPHETIEARVTSSPGPGKAVIDRGSRDGVEVGDRVVFRLLRGSTPEGTVSAVERRRALVDLADGSSVVAAGTRAELRIPASRLEVVPDEGETPTSEPGEDEAPSDWTNEDEDWTPGMPLLTRLEAVAPESRAPRITGRQYVIADAMLTGETDRSDAFLRAGTDVLYENPFGLGGGLEIDGEVNWRGTQLPDQAGDYRSRLRIDRLSYHWGGTRFNKERSEVGRFLQHGVPEFGVLDGYEWGVRRNNGHRYGASAGFMPEPDSDQETGEDFQFSGYYQWVPDQAELLRATGGYQRTYHNGAPDRDLLVGKLEYLPPDGWRFHTTAWIDVYGSGDELKGSGVELTEIIASAGHRWRNGDGLDVHLSHYQFPEIERNEFLLPPIDAIADAHDERLSANAWTWVGRNQRLHGELGGWVDEDDEGGDIEAGLDVRDAFGRGTRADITGYMVSGKFSTILGGRLSIGRRFPTSGWDLTYELSTADQEGFQDDNDDIPLQRLRANFDWYEAAGWSLSLFGEGVLWDDQTGIAAGIYLQRSF